MSRNIKVSLVQYNQVWEDKATNLLCIEEMLEQIQAPTDLIIFPEMFQTGFSMNPEKLAENMDGKSICWLQNQSKKHNASIIASLIIQENGSFFNRMVFISPNEPIQYYDKRKLFTFSGEEKHFVAGQKNTIVQLKDWKILLQVCYDLRFPEIARNKVINNNFNYDLLINVANWPEKRSLHWKILLQARAIENQSFVIGVNRVGIGGRNLRYSGDSSIISPTGEILEQVTNQECVINYELKHEILTETRRKLPFLKDQ